MKKSEYARRAKKQANLEQELFWIPYGYMDKKPDFDETKMELNKGKNIQAAPEPVYRSKVNKDYEEDYNDFYNDEDYQAFSKKSRKKNGGER